MSCQRPTANVSQRQQTKAVVRGVCLDLTLASQQSYLLDCCYTAKWCLETFIVHARDCQLDKGDLQCSIIPVQVTLDLSPVASLHTQLTCLTDGLNWNSPASFRSNHIIGIRGTASIVAGSTRACQPLRFENHVSNLWSLSVFQKTTAFLQRTVSCIRLHFNRKLALHVTLVLYGRWGLWEMQSAQRSSTDSHLLNRFQLGKYRFHCYFLVVLNASSGHP